MGQGGWAFAGYAALLLLVAYVAKRSFVTRCATRRSAVFRFSMLVLLSLPYIWFLCEPDWFNPHIYRVACWIGGPIAIWCIPTASFVIDLCVQGATKRWTLYLIRSVIELLVVFPIWAAPWAWFSFFVLGWGWI